MALIGQLEAEGVMAAGGARDDDGDAPAKKKGASKARGAREGERRDEEE